MAYNIRGITVKINGDTTGLQKAISQVKSQTAGLDSTMSKLKKSMQFNANDYDSMVTYQALVKDKIQSTTKQIDVYKQAISQMPTSQEEWNTAVSETKTQLGNLTTQISSNNSQIKAYKNSIKDNKTQIAAWKEEMEQVPSKATQGAAAIKSLNAQNKELRTSIKGLTTENKNLAPELNNTKAKLDTLGNSFEECTQHTNTMKANALTLKNNLEGLKGEFLGTNTNTIKLYTSLGKLETGLSQVAQHTKVLSLLSGGTLLAATASTVSFEDAWTGVTKTVEGSDEQLEEVNDGLKNLATTTASTYEDIAHYAELAGQMGIPTDSVVGFTETITKLGDTTNLVGDDAAQEIAKIANIMVSDSQKTNTYFERMGSTIVDLGNNFATTESDITSMAKRMATAGKQVGMSTEDILGISTAVSSLGIEANAGGSSISKMVKRIQTAVSTGNENLEKFASVAGMSAEEFSKAWEEDAATAFYNFVKGIGESGDVTGTLNDLGITEVRLSNTMGALAQSSDVLKNALNTSRNAWESNTAMTKEAEKRYGTLKSQISQTWEAIKQAGDELGQAFTPILGSALKVVKNLATQFKNLDEGSQRTIATFLSIGAAISPIAALGSKAAGSIKNIISAANGVKKEYSGLASIVQLLGKQNSLMATGIVAGFALVSGAVITAVNHMEAYKESIIEDLEQSDALYAKNKELVDSFDEYNESVEKAQKSIDKVYETYEENVAEADYYIDKILELNDVENKSVAQKEELQYAVDALNEIYPDLGLQFDTTTGKVADNTGALFENNEEIKEYIENIQKAAKVEAYEKAVKKATEAVVTQELQFQKTSAAYEEFGDKVDEVRGEMKDLSKEYTSGKITADEYVKKQGELETKLEDVRSQFSETGEEIAKMTEEYKESTQDLLDTTNQMETGGFTEIGNSMKTTLQEVVQSAANAGIEIPEKLTEGIYTGEESYTVARDFITNLLTFQQLEQNAGTAGLAIPANIANGIIANAPNTQVASEYLSNMINFNSAVTKAGLTGTQIPQEMATNIANGSLTVDEAIDRLTTYDGLKTEAAEAGIDVPKKIANGVLNGTMDAETASDKLGKAIKKAIKKRGDETEDEAEETAKNVGLAAEYADATPWSNLGQKIYNAIKPWLDSINNAADNTKNNLSNVGSSGGTGRSISYGYSGTIMRSIPTSTTNSLIKGVSGYVTPRVSTPEEIVNGVTYSNMSSSNLKDMFTMNTTKLERKLDTLINRIENVQMTINLQPQELDGEVLTDSVQETLTIRNMLSNYGKGVA